jgi:predicted RNase H-related nuclease YkuK (DUF458 family)
MVTLGTVIAQQELTATTKSKKQPGTSKEESQAWYDANGKKITEEYVYNWIRKTSRETMFGEDPQLIVGTDSHLHGKVWRFITAVCMYIPGKGGNFVLLHTAIPREQFKKHTPARMFHEVGISIEVANTLYDNTEMVPEIHIDASPPEAGEFTSSFSDQLVGYVKSSGFVGLVKPDSWVASSISDRYTK